MRSTVTSTLNARTRRRSHSGPIVTPVCLTSVSTPRPRRPRDRSACDGVPASPLISWMLGKGSPWFVVTGGLKETAPALPPPPSADPDLFPQGHTLPRVVAALIEREE